MKKMIILLSGFCFLLMNASPAISKNYNRAANRRPDYKARPADKDRHEDKARSYRRNQPEYREGPRYYANDGYRERPVDKHRHYEYNNYKGRRYAYHGHWKSWDQWMRYAGKRPDIYKHGSYYRQGGHLMFRFFEPATGSFIFFSIGR